MHPLVVPLTMVCIAWALYSTEELAQIMEEPFVLAGTMWRLCFVLHYTMMQHNITL